MSARMVSISLIIRAMEAFCKASLSSRSLSLGLSSVSTRLRLVAIAFSRSVTFFSSTAPGFPVGREPDFRNEQTRSCLKQTFKKELRQKSHSHPTVAYRNKHVYKYDYEWELTAGIN